MLRVWKSVGGGILACSAAGICDNSARARNDGAGAPRPPGAALSWIATVEAPAGGASIFGHSTVVATAWSLPPQAGAPGIACR